MGFLWIVTILGGCAGALALVAGVADCNGAPHQSAVAAIAVALAGIPYALTLAIQQIHLSPKDQLERLNTNVEKVARASEQQLKV